MRHCRVSTLLFVALSFITLALIVLVQRSQGSKRVLEPPSHRAFATILIDESGFELDAVRTLTWQIRHQHSQQAKSPSVIVFVPPNLSSSRRRLLNDEGAKVVSLAHNRWDYQVPSGRNSLAPLQLFDQTEYDYVLFLQPYTLLLRSLDAIWTDRAATQINKRRSKNDNAVAADGMRHDRSGQPQTYGFASVLSERQGPNAGFWLAHPDPTLLNHVEALIGQHHLHRNASLQEVLNFVYRPDGDMPWKRLSTALWNCNASRQRIIPTGCTTVYIDLNADNNPGAVNPDFMKLWWETQNRMRMFWTEHSKKRGSTRSVDT